MQKAIINNNKKVENIIEYTSDAGIAGIRLPIGYLMWDVTNIPVAIGDDFADGIFTRDGAEIQPNPSADEQIAELRAIIDTMLTGGDAV